MISLRGHHLICLHFFQGEGYSPGFVDNLRKVIQSARSGEQIIVVDGADDVCAACLYLDHGQCVQKPDSEQAIRLLDLNALALLDLKTHQRLTWQQAEKKTMSIPNEQLLEFCRNCDWEKLCRKI